MPDTAQNTERRRKRKARRSASRAVLMLIVCMGVAIYCALASIVYMNSRSIEKLEHQPVDMQQAIKAERYSMLHDSEYFRLFAEKLTYYPHDPRTIDSLYTLALKKAPSSHGAFFSYAYYTGAKNCCRDQLQYLLQQTVKRCPTHPRMQRIAATYFLALNNRDQAMYFIHRSLELEPSSAPELYRMLEQGGSSLETIVSVTPAQSDALIQLGLYLATMNPAPEQAIHETLERLDKQTLTPKQHLQVAGLAFKAGWLDLAARQSRAAERDEETRGDALAFEAQMLWDQGKTAESLQSADRAEQAYRQDDSPDRAVRYAMSIAALQHSKDQVAEAKTRMLRILNNYPNYAPAHYQMAQFSRGDSAELELFYLKKACDLAPDNIEYRKFYAQRLLELNRLEDAQAAYQALLQAGDAQKDAYMGLARCHIALGDNAGALAILQQAVQRAVTSDRIYELLGQLYSNIGEYEKSALAYVEFSKASSNPVQGFNLAGDAYLKLGRYLSARDMYNKALQKDPGNQHARDSLATLQSLGY